MYNPKSKKAEEFICHEEVLESLKFADDNKNNIELIDKILEKAKNRQGLSHREAAVLLDCEIPGKMMKFLNLQMKSNRIITVTELSCLPRYICPITA